MRRIFVFLFFITIFVIFNRPVFADDGWCYKFLCSDINNSIEGNLYDADCPNSNFTSANGECPDNSSSRYFYRRVEPIILGDCGESSGSRACNNNQRPVFNKNNYALGDCYTDPTCNLPSPTPTSTPRPTTTPRPTSPPTTPTEIPIPTIPEPRYATCDQCGFCQLDSTPKPTPGNWEKCRNCLYPALTGSPAENLDTLVIDDTNLPPTPYPGAWYTMIGCISTDVLGGFDKQGAAGRVIQSLLNIIFGLAGSISFLYVIY